MLEHLIYLLKYIYIRDDEEFGLILKVNGKEIVAKLKGAQTELTDILL